MKIKKLELVGFKSFVDRTVLHFDHDVLGIVGPNGCGKSNIVDAIRWCMGEQSARHLRGRSMDDVIFSGSETRTPHDFAEVTLTFENDVPSELPLEYRDYAEIAVTRRLHRSGESEYLVNRTPVRLRDVTDLFLGTGAGTKAYSIVEQGKVGLIVSAKPEERRLLIEEAAGITKFKARKKQAEKKMELTQQNLLRVGDLVAEIDRSLASLKRQAAKAERYVAYRNEVDDLQLHEASHRYLELAGWIKLETSEVEQGLEAHERARTELAAADGALESTRHEVHEAEARVDAAQNQTFAADNALRAEEVAIDRARDRLTALSEREAQAAGEQGEMAAQAARLAAEREVIGRELASLSEAESAEAARLAALEATFADFTGAHRVADARVQERRLAIAAAQTEIARAEAKLGGFERRQNEMIARRERVRMERAALDGARAEIDARARALACSLEALRDGRLTTAAEKEALERRLRELKEQIIGHERALEATKTELGAKRSRHGALREMHARLEGVGAGTKALVATRDATVVGLVADRIEAPPEMTQALAGLLGTRLQDVVVRDPERAMALLEDLAERRKGRASVVPERPAFIAGVCEPLPPGDGVVARLADVLRYAPDDEALVRAVVGDALVVRDVAAAAELRRAGVRVVLVTPNGCVLHPDGHVEGGQGDELAAGMLETKREARELLRDIEQLDTLATRQLETLQAARRDIAQTTAALETARQEAHARELALVTTEKDLQKAEGQLEAAVRRLQALAAEEGELSKTIDEAAAEREEVASGLRDAQARVDAATAELGDAEAALAEARDRLDAQRQLLTAAKVAIAGTREKLAAARGTESRLARSSGELETRAARIEDELVENARQFGETSGQLAGHKEKLLEALDVAARAHESMARERQVFETLRAGLLERETAVRDLRARADAARDALQAHEMALREKELAMEHLLAGVSDKFRGLDLRRVVGDHHMRPPPDEVSRARIDELVKLIERMGSVNLDAMREHAEAEERFAFYTTQKADLEKALFDLERAIQQMNRESRRLFEETFEAVNARFREIFPRMFRGGRGELRMTSPEDLLETGIDIVAQPPGKKLASIELMSGGEKALTAVSLIFAIFQIKPSPFCILDEVDAPLDEANVARYNETVRSMTDRSQFILITHVKRTMQMVDVLYGVTMPEPGVSKIVSVKIN
ncbi:MAG: chromosome segregation protein SMC, partial [Polyangiaceae bacterium]|nr:chromosome segregation protein SMC [Polyangiaceae bacterium]